ncbi:MAG: spore coat protein CotJB [Clostridia bacterium]|nr:spore coat protein CotJB [Clostridia bacterium]
MNRPMNPSGMGCNHGCNHGCGSSNSNGASLLRKIQEIDFSLYETVLYLDVYPDCREALAYYHTLHAQRRALVTQYEREVGPLTAFSNLSQASWDWIRSPWPWQM